MAPVTVTLLAQVKCKACLLCESSQSIAGCCITYDTLLRFTELNFDPLYIPAYICAQVCISFFICSAVFSPFSHAFLQLSNGEMGGDFHFAIMKVTSENKKEEEIKDKKDKKKYL